MTSQRNLLYGAIQNDWGPGHAGAADSKRRCHKRGTIIKSEPLRKTLGTRLTLNERSGAIALCEDTLTPLYEMTSSFCVTSKGTVSATDHAVDEMPDKIERRRAVILLFIASYYGVSNQQSIYKALSAGIFGSVSRTQPVLA